MNIVGKNIVLRALETEDLHILQKWANEPEIQYLLGGWHFPVNRENHLKWFSNLSVNSLDQRFVIETIDFQIIGMVNLVNIDWKNKNAFHGMLLGDKDIRGKGYGRDTVFTIMKYAFEELGFNRLDGSMIEYNEASLKMYIEKCGWREEGRLKQWYYRKGRYWDKILVGITKNEYYELIKNING